MPNVRGAHCELWVLLLLFLLLQLLLQMQRLGKWAYCNTLCINGNLSSDCNTPYSKNCGRFFISIYWRNRKAEKSEGERRAKERSRQIRFSAFLGQSQRKKERERRERRVTRDTYYVTSICVLYHAKLQSMRYIDTQAKYMKIAAQQGRASLRGVW